MMESMEPISKRSRAERDAFIEGFLEGAQMAAVLAPIFDGQDDMRGKINRTMEKFAEGFKELIEEQADGQA